MAFPLYLDEDASSTALTDALRSRGFDVVRAFEVGLVQSSDEEQLLWAASHEKVIYTYNAGDFFRLHQLFLTSARNHAGIIIGHQQRFSIGEQVRKLTRILAAHSVNEMRDQLLVLSNW